MGKLLVLDFGSRFTADVEKVLSENNINYVLQKHDFDIANMDKDIKGIILTGSMDSVYNNGRRCQSEFFKAGLPILGLCYGHQLSNDEFGGEIKKSLTPEIDKSVEVTIDVDNPIFEGMNKVQKVPMFHNDEVVRLGEGFINIAHSKDCKYAASYNKELNIYTLQYHPEYKKYADYSKEYFINFAKICEL